MQDAKRFYADYGLALPAAVTVLVHTGAWKEVMSRVQRLTAAEQGGS